MKRTLLAAFAAFILIFPLASCNSDDSSTSLTMSGSVTYDFPTYVITGKTYYSTISGISVPDTCSYMWYVPLKSTDSIRTRTLQFTIPDTLCTSSVLGAAKANGYYSSTKTVSFTTIDPSLNGSITGVGYENNGSFRDPRDNKLYYTAHIGDLDWMASNLAYEGAGHSYEDQDALQTILGRLYSWNEATGGESGSGLAGGPRGICPKGWTIPTKEDWEDLAKALNNGTELPFFDLWDGIGGTATADAYLNGDRFWPYSPDNLHTNKLYWNALPAGNFTYAGDTFAGLSDYGFWWTALKKDNGTAYYRYIYYDTDTFPTNSADPDDFGASVRCVKLHE
ncbi:MAG: hypothetical protein LKK19_02295 [Bacteroidales bacterium]|nr:hypothetical protein [Bacteroidales bacterium]MCI2121515.1 hypothetical protein [Bacteroidales bacterium]MCI2145543.1 hypothetical protein [Bacteroidales bacterium]